MRPQRAPQREQLRVERSVEDSGWIRRHDLRLRRRGAAQVVQRPPDGRTQRRHSASSITREPRRNRHRRVGDTNWIDSTRNTTERISQPATVLVQIVSVDPNWTAPTVGSWTGPGSGARTPPFPITFPGKPTAGTGMATPPLMTTPPPLVPFPFTKMTPFRFAT